MDVYRDNYDMQLDHLKFLEGLNLSSNVLTFANSHFHQGVTLENLQHFHRWVKADRTKGMRISEALNLCH